MKNLAFLLLLPALFLFTACEKTDTDCGPHDEETFYAPGNPFQNPADIYWGVSGGVRSYTYNWEIAGICTKSNPKVKLDMGLLYNNSTLSNPLSVSGGIYTCLGVQAQHVILAPNSTQTYYESPAAEIGMNQCFSGQASATIYPYIKVSFNTLGSDQADSTYLRANLIQLGVYMDFYAPK